jgi:hypothetical protein
MPDYRIPTDHFAGQSANLPGDIDVALSITDRGLCVRSFVAS